MAASLLTAITIHQWLRMSQARVTVSLFFFPPPQTPLTRTTVWLDSALWEQLSVFLVLSDRGRRRFRKLKRASRLKLFLMLEVERLLLVLVVVALSKSPSAPSARSPTTQEKVSKCFVKSNIISLFYLQSTRNVLG